MHKLIVVGAIAAGLLVLNGQAKASPSRSGVYSSPAPARPCGCNKPRPC